MAGRPPDAGEARSAYLRVRLAEFEVKYMDICRENLSRSDYIRDLIVKDAEARGVA